jgi:glycosyltransferase involved in cell wall biosynthesis
MKILLILASTGPMIGGMERQVSLQAKHMSRLNNTEIAVIAAPCFKNLFPENINFFPLNMNQSRRNPLLLFKVQKIIRLITPNIIHAHGHKAASILSTIKPFLNKEFTLIATAHNVKRSNSALKKMDEVFVVSEGIQKAVMPIHSIIIHNGIEPCSLPPSNRSQFCKDLNLDPNLPLIFGLGRLVKTKQFEYLVRAAKGLNANVVILGDGPELKALQALASENVCLAGYRPDTRSLLYIADMMVITADRDGFSLALIEALHSHLPVLSTRVPGAQDLLPDNCLIDATDETNLRQFLRHHLNSIQALKQSQQAQFHYAETELKIERVAERTYNQYQAAISSSELKRIRPT